jgi:hypothetical protein
MKVVYIMIQKFIVITFAFLISACASKPEKTTTKAEITKCPEQRSQICTREYIPVCATRDTGVRCITAPCPSSEEKTYGNGCTACADAKVIEYHTGACEQEANKNIK